LAFNPANNSLFINNHIYDSFTAEIGIPASITQSTTLAGMPVAPLLQNIADTSEGHLANILTNGAPTRSPSFGGLLVANGKLVGTSYEYYDANNDSRRSHFTHSLTVGQTGTFRGMYQVGSDATRTGFVSGYMAPIPGEWQAAFGGPALTGNCCLSIIGRTSFGPAISVFNPDDLGSAAPVTSFSLLEYPAAHQTLGGCAGNASNSFNCVTEIKGVVFPTGTASMLFWGRRGTGAFCYGEGTNNQSLDRQPVPNAPGVMYCHDPAVSSKGGHAYPYAYSVWAYDANDLAAVRSGARNPWQVTPYAVWDLNLPVAGSAQVQGAAYDPSTQRIYVSQVSGEQLYPNEISQYNSRPLIRVFQVNTSPVASSRLSG